MSAFLRVWHISHHILGQTDVSPCWSELPDVEKENARSFRECCGVSRRLESETPVDCKSACCEHVVRMHKGNKKHSREGKHTRLYHHRKKQDRIWAQFGALSIAPCRRGKERGFECPMQLQ